MFWLLSFLTDFCHADVLKRRPSFPQIHLFASFPAPPLRLHPCPAAEGPRRVPAPQFVQQPSTSSSKLRGAPCYHCLPAERDTRTKKKNRSAPLRAGGSFSLSSGRGSSAASRPLLQLLPAASPGSLSPGKDGEPGHDGQDGYGNIFIPNRDTC